MNSYDLPISHTSTIIDNYDYPNTYTTSSTYTILNTDIQSPQSGLLVEGPATFKKEVILSNGQNLEERLKLIEERLNIPTRDVILESRYERLKELAEEYKQELERCRTWEALKK